MAGTFKQFLKNRFIGQDKVINQLDILGNEVRSGVNLNIALAARSGLGKTTLAKYFVKWVEPNYSSNSAIYHPDKLEIDTSRRLHILDEAHQIANPEFLYPLMDSEEYVFLVVTNEFYKLKEPVTNRCHNFAFDNYSFEELCEICALTYKKKFIIVPRYIVEETVRNFSKDVPRNLVRITERLSFLFRQRGIPSSKDRFIRIAEDLLNIRKGLTNFDIQYLKFLNSVGTASLSTIANSTRIPRQVIEQDIEPYLIGKGALQITNRGRTIVDTQIMEGV